MTTEMIDESTYVVLGDVAVHVPHYHHVVQCYYKGKWKPNEIVRITKTPLNIVMAIIDQEAENIEFMSRSNFSIDPANFTICYNDGGYFNGFDKFGAAKIVFQRRHALRLTIEAAVATLKKIGRQHYPIIYDHVNNDEILPDVFLTKAKLKILD